MIDKNIGAKVLNNKAISFIKNFTYAITSNLIALLVSTLVVLVVPRLIGVEEYGYWQLYLFYSLYVGFFHFGWNDGIYLRYGGDEYKDLDKRLFFSQFYMLIIMQLIIVAIVFIISPNLMHDMNRIFILKVTAICMLFMNARFMLLYILQMTNRIKEYAQITMMDRVLYCCLIILFLAIGVREYKLMVAADLFGKLISLSYAMYCCRDIVFRKFSSFYFSFREALENISVGIKLMFANITSMLIVGVVRFGIERAWDVSTFGKVSLTLSVSNLMMLFINTIGLVLFPILRRTDEKRLPHIYITMNDFLMILLFGALIVYYPLNFVLLKWLPKYTDSLRYMALVFPMLIYEGKMALLINTYLKTLRKEKLMLKVNLISTILSLFITVTFTIVFKSLSLAILSIVILLTFRCVLAETFLSKILNISICKDVVLELTMTLIFILTGWFLYSWLAILVYSAAYVIYWFVKRKDIGRTMENIKVLVKA